MSDLKIVCRGMAVGFPQTSELAANEKNKKGNREEEQTSQPEGIENRKLLLEFAQRQLQLINTANQHIDTKMGVVIGFALLALAEILTGALHISEYELSLLRSHGSLSVVLVISIAGALLASAIAVIFGFLVLSPRPSGNVNVQPGLKERDKAQKELLDGCLEGIDAIIDRVKESNQDRVRHSRMAAGAVGVAIVFYFVLAFSMLMILA